MKGNFEILKQMAMVYINIQMGHNIVDNGNMISNMGMVRKYGLMELSIRVIMWMVKNMGEGRYNLVTVQVMKANIKIIL